MTTETIRLSQRIQSVSGSPTLAISSRAKEMKEQGIEVIDFSVGEPDFPTPEHIKEAGKRAIDEDFTRYTPTTGTSDIKRSISNFLRTAHNLDYSTDQIMVSSGAKSCLYNAAVALFDPGDEVLLPAPYWVSYPEQLRLVGAVPVVIPTDEANDFKITADQLRNAITEKTRALILNNPSNPTGVAYEREELEKLAQVMVDHDLLILADEIYDRIVYDGFEFVSVASLNPKVFERTVTVNGFSKTFAMTGWRLGIACGPKPIISAMARVQSHDTSNPCSISQRAGQVALDGPKDALEEMVSQFRIRRDLILERLSALPGVSCVRPQGAFYVFPNFSRCIEDLEKRGRGVKSSDDLARFLLEQAQVAVVPGEGFGAPGYLRFSYALSAEQIEDGLDRVAKALA